MYWKRCSTNSTPKFQVVQRRLRTGNCENEKDSHICVSLTADRYKNHQNRYRDGGENVELPKILQSIFYRRRTWLSNERVGLLHNGSLKLSEANVHYQRFIGY